MEPHPSFKAYCEQKKLSDTDLNVRGIWLIYGDEQSGSFNSSYVPVLGVYIGSLYTAINKALIENDKRRKDFMFSYWSSTSWGNLVLAKELI